MSVEKKIQNILTENYFLKIDSLEKRKLKIIDELDFVGEKRRKILKDEFIEIQQNLDSLRTEKTKRNETADN